MVKAIVAYLESHHIEMRYSENGGEFDDCDSFTILDKDCDDLIIAEWAKTQNGIAWFEVNNDLVFVGLNVVANKTGSNTAIPQLMLHIPYFDEGSIDTSGDGHGYDFLVDNTNHSYIDLDQCEDEE